MTQQRIEELLDVYKNNVDNPLIQQEVLVEIQADLELLNNEEIRVLLETFSEDDALILWSRLNDKRADDILIDLSGDLQDFLATEGTPIVSDSVNAFQYVDGKFKQITIDFAFLN